MAISAFSKMFDEWGGLDLRSNSKNRQPRFSEDMRNVMPYSNNSWGVRNGVKGYAPSKGGGGTQSFVYTDTSGARQEQCVTIDSNLHKKTAGSITISYSGPAAACTVYLGPDPDDSGRFICELDAVGESGYPLTIDLGTGINEASPVSIATLVTTIDALSDFACTSTGTTSGPAAFLENTQDAVGAGLTIAFSYWTQVYCPTTTPFSTFAGKFSDDAFELATLFNHANRLWIATGYNKLYKYDSVSCYAAGMPAATTYSAAAAAGGALVAQDYETFITYEFTDALGNVVEGNASNVDTTTVGGGTLQITHTVPNILASSQFLTSCAIANNGGTETGTTLTVDNGAGGAHTLQVGQTAYFRDNGGVEREELISAVTATTITIANSRTIANNAVISANLKINIWRHKSGGTIPYLVRTLANDSFNASQTYTDNVADASLEIEYEEPVAGHDLPPENLRYLTAYQNLLVGASPTSDSVPFSDYDGPEYWPSSFRIKSKSNEPIRGVGSNREVLVVFKANETHAVTGDLPNAQYRVELLGDAIGCDSYHSIIDVEGSLWFYSSTDGVQRLQSTGKIDDVGFRIAPAILESSIFGIDDIVHKRVVSFVIEARKLACFFIPVETSTGSVIYPNERSFIFVADYSKQSDDDNEYDAKGRLVRQVPKVRWWKWDSINIAGHATLCGGDLLITERRYNDGTAALEYPLVKFLETGNAWDYCDHAAEIPLIYEAGWVDFEEPDLLKKWLRASIYSFPPAIAASFTITAQLELNFAPHTMFAEKDIVFGAGSTSSGWGIPAWGDITWGDPLEPQQLFTFIPNRATAARLSFSRSVYLELPLISGWNIEAAPVYQNHIKRGAE